MAISINNSPGKAVVKTGYCISKSLFINLPNKIFFMDQKPLVEGKSRLERFNEAQNDSKISGSARITKLVCSLRVLDLLLANGCPKSNYCKYVIISLSMARTSPTAPCLGPHLQFLCKAMEISALPTTAVSEGAGCSTYHVTHKIPIISWQLKL